MLTYHAEALSIIRNELCTTNLGAEWDGHDRYSKLSKLEEENWWNASKEMSELDSNDTCILYPRLLLLIVPIIDNVTKNINTHNC